LFFQKSTHVRRFSWESAIAEGISIELASPRRCEQAESERWRALVSIVAKKKPRNSFLAVKRCKREGLSGRLKHYSRLDRRRAAVSAWSSFSSSFFFFFFFFFVFCFLVVLSGTQIVLLALDSSVGLRRATSTCWLGQLTSGRGCWGEISTFFILFVFLFFKTACVASVVHRGAVDS
jgi:hypothetical protein